jgi:hypothetical protein
MYKVDIFYMNFDLLSSFIYDFSLHSLDETGQKFIFVYSEINLLTSIC